MKLLILTQKVNRTDPILGFFHRWIEEFAKQHCESVIVVCLQEGEHNLPENVRVLSLGKEVGASRFAYVARFYGYIWGERKNYDAVFVHMNPVYIVLGGIFWRIMGKKIGLWYAHKSVDLKLRIAEKLAHIVFTTAPESFQLKSKKVNIMGHGIDIESFKCEDMKNDSDNTIIEILHVGRITPIKNIDILIEAARILKETWEHTFHIALIGGPATASDFGYKRELTALIEKYGLQDTVTFEGDTPNMGMKSQYCRSDASINLAPTGGVDKVVLESMAAGRPVFASNEAFRGYFGIYSKALLFKERDAEDLAAKIMTFFVADDRDRVKACLLENVRKTSNLQQLINSILTLLYK